MEIDSAPISRCSKEHQKIYQEWFSFADSDGDGRLSGADATKFFAMSNMSRQDLKQVWAIADSKRQGFLGFKEFITSMQLVSLAQAGHAITGDILNAKVDFQNLQPPAMEGLDVLLAKRKHIPKSEPEHDGNSQVQSSPSASWFTSSKSAKKISLASVTSIIDGLKRLYVQKLKPLEVTYQFNDFVSPLLANSDFDAKPMVMLLGQYSTGKTTFIKHLLKTGYPGAHIGPEPTTDRFVVVMNGPDERSVPGNTIAVQADMPFSGLTNFGTAFLSKFECSQMPHPDHQIIAQQRPTSSSMSSTVESFSGPRQLPPPPPAFIQQRSRPRTPFDPEECHSDCDSSSSVVDDAECDIASSSCKKTLLFDLNEMPPVDAADVDELACTALRL